MRDCPRLIGATGGSAAGLWDVRLASLNPCYLRLSALQTDHHVAYIGAATDPGTRIARLTRRVLGYLVVFTVSKSLIAVRVVGDITVGAGVFADFDESH